MTSRHSHHKNGTLKSDRMNACFEFLEPKAGSLKTDRVNGPLERSSSGDITPTSYHLTVFELITQLLYINIPSLERKIFLKDLKFTLPSSRVDKS